jgi:hypothetical protein
MDHDRQPDMNRRAQFGFATIIIYALLALAILATLAGIGRSIFNAGVDHEKTEQAVRDAKAQKAADELALQRREDGRDSTIALSVANASARNYEAKWRLARANNQQSLATVFCPDAAPAGFPVLADSAADGGAGVRIRLSSQFLREYDRAWTGPGGQPVFDDPGGPLDSSGTAVTLESLLALHSENASRCSGTARRFNSLIDLVRKLQGRPSSVSPSP